MMYPVKFYLTILGKAPGQRIKAVKKQSLPFAPKVGDTFWIGHPHQSGAMNEALEVCYDLTSELFDIVLDGAQSGWDFCPLASLVEASATLREQGWTIEEECLTPPQTL